MPVSTLLPALASVLALVPAPPADSMMLSLRGDEGTAVVTLDCEPAGGSHPHAERACAALTEADGDFGHLPKQNVLCPLIWDPVAATASGHWHGRPVLVQREYPNRCAANADSGGVFGF
ncbi:SSI family serine proteinase inhibitor [Amycolatopsis sp.]|uniref:SSI family serine proteinase inhibitor n=1 Tax=Amycolatopsis sp. TaxID=37632 RepID=UPI002BF10322|nr:SSI family serine proteinase inhibitor [Amycolatopsis sp.]HVV09371.1 SSI family serine proteinase inhibitor [Amycolatopsis sp.]